MGTFLLHDILAVISELFVFLRQFYTGAGIVIFFPLQFALLIANI